MRIGWPHGPGHPWTVVDRGLAPRPLRLCPPARIDVRRARCAAQLGAAPSTCPRPVRAHAGSDALAAARRRGMATISSYQNTQL